jgi:hypothetical protein
MLYIITQTASLTGKYRRLCGYTVASNAYMNVIDIIQFVLKTISFVKTNMPQLEEDNQLWFWLPIHRTMPSPIYHTIYMINDNGIYWYAAIIYITYTLSMI